MPHALVASRNVAGTDGAIHRPAGRGVLVSVGVGGGADVLVTGGRVAGGTQAARKAKQKTSMGILLIRLSGGQMKDLRILLNF